MFLGIRMGICKYINYWKRSSDDGSMMGSIPAASTAQILVRGEDFPLSERFYIISHLRISQIIKVHRQLEYLPMVRPFWRHYSAAGDFLWQQQQRWPP